MNIIYIYKIGDIINNENIIFGLWVKFITNCNHKTIYIFIFCLDLFFTIDYNPSF